MRKAYVVHTQPFHCSYEDGRWATDLYAYYENVFFDRMEDYSDNTIPDRLKPTVYRRADQ